MGRRKRRKTKWYKPKRKLAGWKSSQKKATRMQHLRTAQKQRGRGKITRKSKVSTGRALQALSNVTKDKKTKQTARADAKTLFKQAKSMK
ncbi:MAG: hypothetical protein ACE5H0_07195 [Bacteroidota bacterium]